MFDSLRPKLPLAALASACLLFAACSPQLARDVTVQLECSSDADCVSELVCSKEIGRCVPARGRDTEPPAPREVQISPATVGMGKELTVQFTSSEPIFGEPRVSLATTPPRPLVREPAEAGYRFRLQLAGDEGEGSVAIVVSMVDVQGNATVDAALGQVTLDFKPPTALELSVADRALRQGEQLAATLRVSEPLASPPSCWLQPGGEALQSAALADPVLYRLNYTVTGEEAAGPATVVCELQDRAGNVLVPSSPDAVRFDFQPPAFVGRPAVAPAFVTTGRFIAAELETTEPLGEAPRVRLASGSGTPSFAMLVTPISPSRFVAFRSVLAEDPEGEYLVVVDSLVDEAGNAAARRALAGTVTIDRTPPAFLRAQADKRLAFYRVGEIPEVRVEVDESLPAPPAVTLEIDTRVLPCVAADAATPNAYRCAAEAPLTAADPEVSTFARIEIADRAGNVNVRRVPLTFDFTPPGLLSGRLSPAQAKQGEVVSAVLTPDEPLAEIPTIELSPDGPILAHLPGTHYLFAYLVVPLAPEGTFTGTAQLVDWAGNTASVELTGSVTIDLWPPVIRNVVVSPRRIFSRQAGYSTVGLGFDCEDLDDVAGGIDVRIDGKPMTCGLRYSSSPNYRCQYAIGAADTAGPKEITVLARDGAGNIAVAGEAVAFDFTAPAVEPSSVALRLVSPAAALEPEVTAAGVGTTVLLSFTCNETLSSLPTLSAISAALPATTVTIAPGTRQGNFYSFSHTLAAGTYNQGSYRLAARLVDAAGNSATVTVTDVMIDTLAPAEPAVATPGRVRYHRVPHGSAATSDQPSFAVEGAAGAVEAGARVLVFDAADPATAREIGVGRAGDDGAFGPIALARADRSDVFLLAVDRAANWSTASAGSSTPRASHVRDATWTMSLAGKTGAAAGDNPSSLAITGVLRGSLHQPEGWASVADAYAKLAASGDAALAVAGEPVFRMREPRSGAPDVRNDCAIALDPVRGEGLLFGGRTINGTKGTYFQDLLGLASASGTWTSHTAVAASWPEHRYSAAMTYDVASERLVLFGGSSISGLALDDLWLWDPKTGLWTRGPLTGGPSKRWGHAMAYDSDRRLVMLYGGRRGPSGYEINRDLWTWNTRTGQWRWVATGPDAVDHGLVYDAARKKTVLVTMAATVWESDEAAATMVQRFPVAGSPAPASSRAVAYDRARQRVVLFGGTGGNELWEWDPAASRWANRTPAPVPEAWPEAGAETVRMQYDPTKRRVQLWTMTPHWLLPSGAVWEWDGESWQVLGRAKEVMTTVTGRTRHAATYDRARGRTVVFGGLDMSQNRLVSHLEWDPVRGRWESRPADAAAPSPAARADHALAYDETRARVVLFGGETASGPQADCWEWDGATGAWTDRTPVPLPAEWPAARTGHAMVYDPRSGHVLLFGGIDATTNTPARDLWEWDGTAGTWTQRAYDPTLWPYASAGSRMAYDRSRESVVLVERVGEFDRALDWLVDGTWQALVVESSPYRYGFALSFDEARGRTVKFGGATSSLDISGVGYFADLSEIAAEAWDLQERVARGSGAYPLGRRDAVLVYQPGISRHVLFGGLVNGTVHDDRTWELDLGAADRPGVIWTVPWAFSAQPEASLQRLSVKAFARGTGWDGGAGASADAVALEVWDPRQLTWRPLDSGSGEPTAGPQLEAVLGDAADVQGLPLGTDRSISFAVAPAHPTGMGNPAQVSVDYLEATFEYRSAE